MVRVGSPTFPLLQLKNIRSDYENIFKEKERQELLEIITDYESKTTREIYIVTTDNLYGYEDYDTFMTDLFIHWQIGKLPEANGALILISKSNRKFAIRSGKEAEEKITDEMINQIVGEKVIPHLKEDNFFKGTISATKELIKLWN